MQKRTHKNYSLLLKTESQLYDKFVPKDHAFRKLHELLDIEKLAEPLRELYSSIGSKGIDVEKGLRALLVQFWEDYSDREMERCLRENMAVRWFCGFRLDEDTPVWSYFSKLRSRLGAQNMADLFNASNKQLRHKGLFGDTFTFVDASSLITKSALWEERDKAIADGEEKLNNAIVSHYAADKDAKWGAKGKNKIWFGYKRHASVDMRHGLINKLVVTPANVLDFQIIEDICPSQGMVFMDKLYDTKRTWEKMKELGCTPAIIRKRNNKEKNIDLDRWRSKTRMPFEGTFSKLNKRTRYRGLDKVLFQCLAEALTFNMKKAVRIL